MAKDVEQDLSIEGGEKPTQTKDRVPRDVLQREVRPQVKMNMQKIHHNCTELQCCIFMYSLVV